jgi:cardiolipin synthase A/B
MTHTHLVAGHNLTLLRNGEEYFPRLVAAIDAAQRFVYLETYIYAPDKAGSLLAAAFKRAAARGVVVRVLLDGYGSAALPEQWIDELRSAGVEVLWFRKEVGRFSFRRYHLRRLHRKLAVIDGQIAFIGGINITDDLSGGLSAPRLDYAVEVEGAVVHDMHVAMRRLWLLVSWTHFHRQGERDKVRVLHRVHTQQQVQFVTRDSLRHRRDIEHAYLKAIAEAQHEIIIANAYFLPGRRFRRALREKAQAGVRVILLLQGRVEYRLQHYATLALYDEFLKAGVEIHEYQSSFMHAKVAVVDGTWSTIGSSNIDPFSLWLAREANLMVSDAAFAGALRTDLLHMITQHSRRVLRSGWREWNIFLWLLMRFSYGFTRLLTGIIGRAKESDDI